MSRKRSPQPNSLPTPELIESLVQDLNPVRPLFVYPIRFALFFLLVGLGLFVWVLLKGFRPDFHSVLETPSFWAEMGFAAATAFLTGWAAFQLSVPGETESVEGKKDLRMLFPVRAWGVVSLLIWMGIVSLRFQSEGMEGGWRPMELKCAQTIFLFSVPFSLALFFVLRRAQPFRWGWSGFLGALSVASFVAIALQLECPGAAAAHLLFFHLLPVLGVGVLGLLVGRFLLRGLLAERSSG